MDPSGPSDLEERLYRQTLSRPPERVKPRADGATKSLASGNKETSHQEHSLTNKRGAIFQGVSNKDKSSPAFGNKKPSRVNNGGQQEAQSERPADNGVSGQSSSTNSPPSHFSQQQGGSCPDVRAPGSKRITFEEANSFIQYLGMDERLVSKMDEGTFYYLKPVREPKATIFQVELTTHDQIDPANYFTFSKRGVTHFTGGSSDYTPLGRWEREFTLFKRLMKIPFFKKYMITKSFMQWRASIRSSKTSKAKNHLRNHLFILNPILQAPLLTIRSMCVEVSALRLTTFNAGKILTLPEFMSTQSLQREKVVESLVSFFLKIERLVSAACDRAFDTFLQENKINPELKMTFMEKASLRRECAFIANFMTLVEEMILSSLLDMSIDSISEAVNHIRSLTVNVNKRRASQSSLGPSSLAIAAGLHTKSTQDGRPLFLLEVEYDDERDSLLLIPTPEEFSRHFTDVVDFATSVLSTHQRVREMESLQVYNETVSLSSGETKKKGMPYANGNIEEGDPMDQAKSVLSLVRENERYVKVTADLLYQISMEFSAARSYTSVFDEYMSLYQENKRKIRDMDSLFPLDVSIRTYREAIAEYKEQAEMFDNIPQIADIGVFRVDSTKFRETILPSPKGVLSAIQASIPKNMGKTASSLLEIMNEVNPIAASAPSSLEAFVEKVAVMARAEAQLPVLREKIQAFVELCTLLEEEGWSVPHEQREQLILMREGVSTMDTCLVKFDGEAEEEARRWAQEIVDSIPLLNKKVQQLREQLDHPMISSSLSPIHEVLKYLGTQQKHLAGLKEQASKLNDYQRALKREVTEWEDILSVESDLSLKLKLWDSLDAWGSLSSLWMGTRLSDIDAEEIAKQVQLFGKVAFQASKSLPHCQSAALLRDRVEEFRLALPVVQDMRNKALKDRHWDAIHALLGFQVKGVESFTLGKLIEMRVMDQASEISAIAVASQQEAVLEEMLEKVRKNWVEKEFEVKPYKESKEVFILGSMEEIIASLDDSLVSINTILASRFVGPIKEQVESWRGKLVLFQETLDEWLAVQRSWMYLETIFSAPDIQRQLPEEAKLFAKVDVSWKAIMMRTHDNPLALPACTHPGLKDQFQNHNANLDKIQKSLEDYLETKRQSFPRFYFLSNDELLEILAQSKNPQAVQPHLRKCFENLVKIDFGDAVGGSLDMLAMFSAEGERVPLGKNLKARGSVEDWLKALELNMKSSLHKLMKAGLLDYDARPRSEWILEHPAQVVATVAQITWARGTEKCLRAADPVTEMKAWYQVNVAELDKLIVLIRGQLTKLQRLVIVALVTTDVHARDIVSMLVEDEVTSLGSFAWQQQLRYYWNMESDDVQIRHSDSTCPYGYEYYGATSRLVITPLTDRCWLTLSSSLALKLGAAPSGPAGTGKTESSKDLAKALAIQCVVFNCSDQIDYKMMGKLFRGLAQAGSWACLDEFNRIDIEVLSVIAQQVLTLRQGRLEGKSTINFMGVTIPLLEHHIIITMNPGYAGRTELPDNLKVLFRPVSMMVPDYSLIAEIMLFAEGFSSALSLSRKMCKLYILCSEQLSQQPHYDYGLRAVKSVLVMAGALKRASEGEGVGEELTLIRALRDSNLPKFLAEDLPLFHAIVSDLFPGAKIPANDYGEFQLALASETAKAGFQIVESFSMKVLQLFETFNVRFGGCLVGAAGSGKSSCYRLLQGVMTTLRQQNSKDERYQEVLCEMLNPKSITMGELYGEFNELTQEWHDGLASSIMRRAAAEAGPGEEKKKRWTVFDGPIDALWIENMNTVLDDNMTLCLANGERIKLRKEMKMLFEVADLAVASPATVSRIGVVFLSPSDLGWRPYLLSWGDRVLSPAPKETRANIILLMEKLLDKGLSFLREKGLGRGREKEAMSTVDVQMVASLCSLVHALMERGGIKTTENANLQRAMEKIVVFAIVWSMGATITSDYWESFDSQLRRWLEELGLSKALSLPSQGLVYDYFLDQGGEKAEREKAGGEFRAWGEIVPTFRYKKSVPFFQILVPTVDTVRYSFLLSLLISEQRPVFITGGTGTGKTVVVQNLLSLMQRRGRDAGAQGEDDAREENEAEKLLLPRGEGTRPVLPVTINFSAQTSSLVTQATMESKLEKKRKNLLGPPSSSRVIFFVDDVNLPAVEEYGAQPPIELLRQYLEYGGVYDREKLFWKEIVDTLLLVAAAPPGGGRAPCSPRFLRHFSLLYFRPASDQSMGRIFESILSGFLEPFSAEVRATSGAIVKATVEVYNKISSSLLPTPVRFHYTFNMRDVSKVFQGMLMISKIPSADVLVRLWVHETLRVFSDRLISDEDRKWLSALLTRLLKEELGRVGEEWDEEKLFYDEKKPLLFVDFLRPGSDERPYEECGDVKKVTKILDDALDLYNLSYPSPLSLVFFTDAIQHIARISRALRSTSSSSLLLVGVGGSGRQSLTRLASFLAGFSCFMLEIGRGYGVNEFREDVKKMMIRAGVEGKKTVFLFTDSQIISETFVEDINSLLNSGEVPNLFPPDEREKILTDMSRVLREQEGGGERSRDECASSFLRRVRENLSIVLCMSPVGPALRVRCRQFPSLISCTTIDWYMPWPQSALESVAQRFLSSVPLSSESHRDALVRLSGIAHSSSSLLAERFYAELRRRMYTTPKSYLDLISLFVSLLGEKREEKEKRRERMRVGVEKLRDTNKMVEGLQEELEKLQPVLKLKTVEVEQLLKQVAKDQQEASLVRERVSKDEQAVKRQADEVAAVQADAQKDLDVALPALEAAVAALDGLSKNDLTEVKSFTKPPVAVQTVMEAVCILLGVKTDWDSAKKLLGEVNLMDKLKTYDKDNIPPQTLKKLQKYIEDPGMAVEVVRKVSKAACSLCMWVHAMNVYSKVAKEVEPKRKKLEEMNQMLAEANGTLSKKQEELRIVNEKVAGLERECQKALEEKERLALEAEKTAKRLLRAEKLTSGLAAEGVRWSQTVESLTKEIDCLVGDTFLAAASISYFGAFTGPYRQELVGLWKKEVEENSLPFSGETYSLANVLGNPVEIREWQLSSLPSDSLSVENAIMVTRGKRWPLMIDPQGQASKWIKNSNAKFKLEVGRMSSSSLLRTVENCIRVGRPLLLEDLGEILEPSLESVLQKATFKQGGRTLIRLGDQDIDYDPNFKLFLSTKLSNPHYLPEVCIKVNIINFTVTREGLEDQLLGEVVKRERPDVEERKSRLVLSMAQDRKQLKEIEEKILRMISESQGDILDDDNLINTLASSNVTSKVIKERVTESEKTEKEINEARENYRPVARRGSILFFVIAEMANIDPMYQYSLSYFQRLFVLFMDKADKSPELKERLQSLLEVETYEMYLSICRGLFERHKTLFSSLICLQILRDQGEISETEWNLLIRGPGVVDPAALPPNPQPDKIREAQWQTLYALETRVTLARGGEKGNGGAEKPGEPIYPFRGLTQSIATQWTDEWASYLEAPDISSLPLPCGYSTSLSAFHRLLLIRTLRDEKSLEAMVQFVRRALGQKYTESPQVSMNEIYRSLDSQTPCVFVLSPGADPTDLLLRLAKEEGFSSKLQVISLGQGQGPHAEALIARSREMGEWVLLQNCHLARSWLPNLEKIVLDLAEGGGPNGEDDRALSPAFRLFLTSFPAAYFPVAVLQNSVKLTNEPPKGLKANLLRSFTGLYNEETYEEFSQSGSFSSALPKFVAWKKLLLGLAFFHATVQERRKFGPLGWNISYEFNDTDLQTSIAGLRKFLTEQEDVPWDALRYVTGQINYGGRVTDDWDRRCLLSILSQYCSPNILQEEYRFSPSGLYYAPSAGPYREALEYLQQLPPRDEPETFGMNRNANITYERKESSTLFEAILELQPRESGGGTGMTSDEIVLGLIKAIEEQLPPNLEESEAGPTTFVLRKSGDREVMDSLSTVLRQEMEKFNRLLDRLRSSLSELRRAINGLVVMSSELDKMYTSFINNKVPDLWVSVSFASLKGLGSWVKDLLFRVAFMRSWLVKGRPNAFPLPVFFFPQGFMTGALQNHSRKYSIAIDTLAFTFNILDLRRSSGKVAVEEVPAPEDGVIVYGLWLEGARYDEEERLLKDSKPSELYTLLPPVHFIPAVNPKRNPQCYSCPVYKTSVRRGVLSTTGLSTNFVVAIELDTKEDPAKWVLNGAALLCNLDN